MDNPTFRSAVDGVTAAATGALAGAVIVLGRRALVDAASWGIALATLVLLWKARRIPEPILILGAAVAGLLVRR
jgi:chromate transporter